MHVHLLRHHAPATNGAPQTVAAGFALLIFFTLTFPFVQLASGGATTPEILMHLINGEAGVNVFALLVLITPLLGILVAMTARSAWRIGTMLIALIGLCMVPLAILVFNRNMTSVSHGLETAAPGLGSYVLTFGYFVLLVVTGITAFRARHS